MRQLVNNVQFSSIHEESRSEKKRKEKKKYKNKKRRENSKNAQFVKFGNNALNQRFKVQK